MNSSVSTKALYQQVYQTLLKSIQEKHECEAMTQWLLSHYFQLDFVDRVVDRLIVPTAKQHQSLASALARLSQHEPIQYILEEAPFFGRNFQVTPEVLIPRPETEAMVQDIIHESPQAGAHVLDLGTGSGCIAITLQLELEKARAWAVDIHPMLTAKSNAQKLGASVQWLQADLLKDPLPDHHWHIIVSNPPYIRPSEKPQMHQRVLDYEPAQALFVPEDHPLVFHEKIVKIALLRLIVGGKLYLEINESLGDEVAQLYTKAGFEDVNIKQDIHGKDRWVVGSLNR